MTSKQFDVIVVGAGFSGMYLLHLLRSRGHKVRVLERGSDVGGTWYWNRYPGARCDVESMEYSYQFSEELQQDWDWSERYAPQPEILQYANHVADRFDLRRDIQFETNVSAAAYQEDTARWRIETAEGEVYDAKFFIMATGCLSSTNKPQFKGADSFKGSVYHTGNWPHEPVDFTGKRVAVIGTGSSAIQCIPQIAAQAAHLTVFQRTANYAVPARNGPLDPDLRDAIKANYPEFRANAKQVRNGLQYPPNDVATMSVSPQEREAEFRFRWDRGGVSFAGAFNDLLLSAEANEAAANFVRDRIRETVNDPKVAELLCPKSVIACKRLCVDIGYFETYNRPNVTLVDISEAPIEEFTPAGVKAHGEVAEVDAIVLATGFDAMTGALLGVDIRGRQGQTLREKWAAGPCTYLGLSTAGFPNFFMVTGPGSPSVLTNMLPSIEQHVEWISDLLDATLARGARAVEPERQAEEAWVEHVNALAGRTLYPTCNSWYLGANVPGKPRVFMPYLGFPTYVAKCDVVARNGYLGFAFT
ncbi:MAG: NAD(P)/FAD-dependent oxidoreductase [Rhizobiales bacterium]|nr:NAD(P)/FAD-dependent oxidoreductase [Hyphomicrobiales bacterium]